MKSATKMLILSAAEVDADPNLIAMGGPAVLIHVAPEGETVVGGHTILAYESDEPVIGNYMEIPVYLVDVNDIPEGGVRGGAVIPVIFNPKDLAGNDIYVGPEYDYGFKFGFTS